MPDRILAIVRKIPRGKVCTYGGVARAAGFPGAARQVVWDPVGRIFGVWHERRSAYSQRRLAVL